MIELLATLDAWSARGLTVSRAVVVRTFGSSPRPAGASLLLASDGSVAGSVSGGCVEGAAIAEIERARGAGRVRVIRYGISDEQAWDVGLACGGTIDVLVEPLLPEAVVRAARGASDRRLGGRALVTRLPADAPPPEHGPHRTGDGEPPRAPWILGPSGQLLEGIDDDGLDGTVRDAARGALARGLSMTAESAAGSYFIEAFPVRPRVVIVGGVQTAMSLVRLAAELGYETVVVDGRPVFATDERFPEVDRLIVGWLDEEAEGLGLGPDDAVAVLSHDPKFDEPAIIEALRRGCRYVGAVGSRKTQRDRRERLRAAGVEADALARLRGPIGLDLGGRSPAETALAIMAEVVATRYAASGRPMVEMAAERSGPA